MINSEQSAQAQTGRGQPKEENDDQTPPTDDEKKAAKAHYMRYYRGFQNLKKMNPEFVDNVKSGKKGLFDLWLECQEDWQEVVAAAERYRANRSVDFAIEDYKTKAQLMDMYKSTDVVETIIAEKKARGGSNQAKPGISTPGVQQLGLWFPKLLKLSTLGSPKLGLPSWTAGQTWEPKTWRSRAAELQQLGHPMAKLLNTRCGDARFVWIGGEWIKKNPDAPNSEEALLYLCWSGAGKRREKEIGDKFALKGKSQLDGDDESSKAVIGMLLKPLAEDDSTKEEDVGANTPAPNPPKRQPKQKT